MRSINSRRTDKEIWTVTQLVKYLAMTIEQDAKLQRVWLSGEISNFSQNAQSKHIYLTLKDGQSRVRAVMFASNSRRLRFIPRDGDQIVVKGYLSLYDREGQLQFYIQDMKLGGSGTGDLFAGFERLKERLADEGLFAKEKRSLPAFPKTIGVVTSPTGAAIRDIITTLNRRFPLADILLCPVSVQGELAAAEIADAVELMNKRTDIDLLIVGRGGGSLEELWAFNEECVARAIYKAHLPVISAVGHETDVTISDFVADVRAATPTAAAELSVPHQDELTTLLENLRSKLMNAYRFIQTRAEERLQAVIDRPVIALPTRALISYDERLDKLKLRLSVLVEHFSEQPEKIRQQLLWRCTLVSPAQRLERATQINQQLLERMGHYLSKTLQDKNNRYLELIAMLEALSPLKVLARGYAIAYAGSDIVRSVQMVAEDDLINIRLSDGVLQCRVIK